MSKAFSEQGRQSSCCRNPQSQPAAKLTGGFRVYLLSQRVHVGVWYILRAQRGSHIGTLRPKYIPYCYMDPLGVGFRVRG